MRSENDILKLIKAAAVAAVEENDPQTTVYGTVTEADPETGKIKAIQVDQQWIIDGDQIVLPHEYQDREVKQVKVKGNCIAQLRACLAKCEIEYELDEGCTEDEALVDIELKDYIKTGDKVAITRQQGGQKFVIAGRTAVSE